MTLKKTFNSDKPLLRHVLLLFGVAVASFVGTIAAILLTGTILR